MSLPNSSKATLSAQLQALAQPLFQSAVRQRLRQDMPLEVAAPDAPSRASVSHLEAVGRLLCGMAPMLELQADQAPADAPLLADARFMLDSITNPASPDHLNFSQGTQPLVDAAFLAAALLRAPKALWADLPAPVHLQVETALRATHAIRPHFNNWLLFAAVIEAFFCRNGLAWDPMRVDYALRQHEQWYLGDGVYGDGPSFHHDYYNSFVIYPLLLETLGAVQGQKPDWDRMHERVLVRAQRHAVQLERLIGPDGTFPPVGRSLTYRCGAFHLLAWLAWKQQLPDELPPAQVRDALAAVIDRTLGSPLNYDDGGWLRIGLNGAQPGLGENYISTGSLYLCSTAFLPLGLPEDAPFWTGPETPWTQRRLWWLQTAPTIDKALKA